MSIGDGWASLNFGIAPVTFKLHNKNYATILSKLDEQTTFPNTMTLQAGAVIGAPHISKTDTPDALLRHFGRRSMWGATGDRGGRFSEGGSCKQGPVTSVVQLGVTGLPRPVPPAPAGHPASARPQGEIARSSLKPAQTVVVNGRQKLPGISTLSVFFMCCIILDSHKKAPSKQCIVGYVKQWQGV